MAIFDLRGRNLRAVNDKVVVLKATRPNKSAGGLFLPDEDVRTYCEGKVLSVGPEVKSCKAGDEIIWQVFKGQAAGHHDEQRWVLADADVLAVLEPSDPPMMVPASAPASIAKDLVPSGVLEIDKHARPTPKAR